MSKTALVVGATGLIGGELVRALLKAPEYDKVIIWVRRSMGLVHLKLEEKIIDFDKLESYSTEEKVNHVFCCLGATIKKAKTQEAFKKVDLEYPIALGRWAKNNGASQFLVVSSVGANSKSKLFYSRTKGQLEEGLREIGIKGLKIYRPSLLLGDRNEFRLGESISAVIFKFIPFIFAGPFKQYKPVEGRNVAYAMYKKAIEENEETEIISSFPIVSHYGDR